MATAGEVHSIRLPAGTAREVREVTGEKISTLARRLVLAYLERAKQESKQ